MNRINQLFQQKRDILSVYFTAGYPNLEDTSTVLKGLMNSGVDLIEIGMPFSDPLADGPTIQRSSEIALENGMSTKQLFEQLKYLKNRSSEVPLILMGYLNPILRYGLDQFCREAATLGIDGLIIPDLPVREYLEEYKNAFEKYGLLNIFLITPQTPEARIRLIDQYTEGFIYVVSSAGTTGARQGIKEEQEKYFERIRSMKLKSPLMIGFGISDHDSFLTSCRYANGAIIGSAFIRAISESKELEKDIEDFVNGILIEEC